MALKLITQEHSFEEPGTINQTVDVGGTIYKGQATVVLRSFQCFFEDGESHHLKKVVAKVTNVKVKETSVEYDLEFNFMDDTDHLGYGSIIVLVVADVD
ncbi:MAG: hypothetical protein K2W92_07755, partial [Alphaproteobacteria bacterium]|nr:hypothetical protein [Alphaproteobacteria bacterium]